MKELKKAVVEYATELVMAAGAALVSLGTGMYSMPAGIIAAGVFLLAGAGAQQLLRCWQGRSSRGAGQKNTAPGREGRHFLEKTGKGP